MKIEQSDTQLEFEIRDGNARIVVIGYPTGGGYGRKHYGNAVIGFDVTEDELSEMITNLTNLKEVLIPSRIHHLGLQIASLQSCVDSDTAQIASLKKELTALRKKGGKNVTSTK